MTTDDVTFAARCPICDSDATWRQIRTSPLKDAAKLSITCAQCGPTDSVTVVVEAIRRNGEVA